MKKYLLALLLLSCHKEEEPLQESSRGQAPPQYFITSAHNLDTVEGVKGRVWVENLGGGNNTLSAWVSMYVWTNAGIEWFQIGYTNEGRLSPAIMAFGPHGLGASVPGVALNQFPALKEKTFMTFGIELINSEVVFVVDGIQVAKYPGIGARFGAFTQVAIECGGSWKPARFPTITASPAFTLKKTGIWAPATTASSHGSGYGIEGTLQNASLPPNTIRMGTDIKSPPGSTLF